MNKLLQFISFIFIGLRGFTASAEVMPVTWRAQSEHVLVVSNITALVPDSYCLVGADLDTQSARTQAIIQVLNPTQSTPIWVTHASLNEKDFFQNRFTHCSAIGDSIYGVEEVDTQSSASLSQTLIFINRFNKEGHCIARKQVVIGTPKPWSIGLTAIGQTLYLLAGDKETQAKNSFAGMHLISLSSNLEDQRSVAIPNGAFFYPSKMLTLDRGLFLVGPFSKSAQEEDAELAAARLSLKGKYLWAQHFPYAANKAIYTLDPQTQEIRVSVIRNGVLESQSVNAEGKASNPVVLKSTACRALGHLGNLVRPQVLALNCGKPPQVTNTDLATGTVISFKKLDQKPLKYFDLPDSVFLVMRSNSDAPEYQFLQIKK